MMKATRAQRWLTWFLASGAIALLGLNVWYFAGGGGEHSLVDSLAPELRLPMLEAGSASATRLGPSDFRGKVVLVDFWATHCGPCRMQMPTLIKLQAEFPAKDFDVLSINVDSPGEQRAAKVARYVAEERLPFPVLLDNGKSTDTWAVDSIPTMVIIDRLGRVRTVHVGLTSQAALETSIRAALGDTPEMG